jgi:hypothetical protein
MEHERTGENPRRVKLQRLGHGELKLKNLKFADSSDPKKEMQRRIEDHPLSVYQLRDRLRQLPPDQPPKAREFVLSESHDVKVLGFNDSGPAATTGTSKTNVLCLTDGMGPCIGIALGAEKIDRDGVTRLPGAKARVLHVPPAVDDLDSTLRERIEGYASEGLTVRAALHGGWLFNEAQAEATRTALRNLLVTLEFDETCEKRPRRLTAQGISVIDDTPLGAVVGADYTVRFVTGIAYRP